MEVMDPATFRRQQRDDQDTWRIMAHLSSAH
jgi:hypothetical protein